VPAFTFAPSPCAAPITALATAASTWHRRLRHPGVDALSKLSSNSSVIYSRCTHDFCHACQFDCHTRMPFASSTFCVDNIFDLIHCDLWTSLVVSVSYHKYYLLIIDDCFYFVGTFPLRVKSDTFSTLSNFSPLSPHSLVVPSKLFSVTMTVSSTTPPLEHSSPLMG
jgi:hypothetical protein